jgi:hypothetical protein
MGKVHATKILQKTYMGMMGLCITQVRLAIAIEKETTSIDVLVWEAEAEVRLSAIILTHLTHPKTVPMVTCQAWLRTGALVAEVVMPMLVLTLLSMAERGTVAMAVAAEAAEVAPQEESKTPALNSQALVAPVA